MAILRFYAGIGFLESGTKETTITLEEGETLAGSGNQAPIANFNGKVLGGWYEETGKRLDVNYLYTENTAFYARYVDHLMKNYVPIVIGGKPVAARPYVFTNGKWIPASAKVYSASRWHDTACPANYIFEPVTINVAHMPSQDGVPRYTGEEITPAWKDYYPDEVTITDLIPQTDVGTYYCYVTPNPGFTWNDGSSASRTLTWVIKKQVSANTLVEADLPKQINIPTYTGDSISPEFEYDDTKMEMTDDPEGTESGTYDATFTAKEGYEWADDIND